MKKVFLTGIVFIVSIVSCNIFSDDSIDAKIKSSFKTWAKEKLEGNYKIIEISYDTVGCPLDYIYKGYMLNQTVGSSGKTDNEWSVATKLIMREYHDDSVMFHKDIIVAKISVQQKVDEMEFYIGMRGDSIYTEPKDSGYEALKNLHSKGEQIMYETCNKIYSNLMLFANEESGVNVDKMESNEDFYSTWAYLPGYNKTMQAIGAF